VANLSRRVARQAGLSEDEAQEIYIAGLLHDVGKVGLLDRILNTKFIELPLGDAQTYRKHCEMGQASLKILDDLGNVGLIVRSHHEYFNGSGYPDGLAGDDIPVGARIVGMVEAFEELISGDYAKEPCSPKEAKKVIASNRGKLFCPDLCDHFVTVLDDLLG
jgi:response regulator RpfG family c-di-GMP phosphodiesterase